MMIKYTEWQRNNHFPVCPIILIPFKCNKAADFVNFTFHKKRPVFFAAANRCQANPQTVKLKVIIELITRKLDKKFYTTIFIYG